MSSVKVEKYEGAAITDELLSGAATLFGLNYGVWGPLAAEKMGAFAKQGSRVKISPTRLKNDILPPKAKNTYIRLLLDDELAGNVFGTRWLSPDGNIMLWVTQLCVSSKRRNSRIATRLLQELRQKEDTYVGILSSYTFGLSAILRVFGNGLENTDLETTRKYAKDVMESCPVRYVREAKIRGSLFENYIEDGSISCADTQFWVDHREPLDALAEIKEKGIMWRFGQLSEGHEFLLLVKGKTID